MKLFYWEQGHEVATDEDLPQTCTTLKKAQVRASQLFTNALHEKQLIAPKGSWGAAWAGICDDTGAIISWLYRENSSWLWKEA